MITNTLRFSTYLVLIAALLGAALLTALSHEALSRLASESAGATRAQPDAGGQTASPNPGNRGAGQEERVRAALGQDYEQRFGGSDEAIRNALGIRGKVADFVGYNARTHRWLIAESKGGDIGNAVSQLRNTTQGLIARSANVNQIDVRIYVNTTQHDNLLAHRLAGWAVDEAGFLGWYDELSEWHYELIQGLKILVQAVAP